MHIFEAMLGILLALTLVVSPVVEAGEEPEMTPAGAMFAGELMFGTDEQTLEMKAGEQLACTFQVNFGDLSVLITDSEGTELYAADPAQTCSFLLPIETDGPVTISVTGSEANYTLDFKIVRE